MNKTWLVFLLILLFPIPSIPQAKGDPGQISGYAFGDYYFASEHHNPAIEGMNGFWFRRIYLTYDKKLDSEFATRLRLEMNSPGDFTSSSTLNPYVKDAYLQYSKGNIKGYLGMSPTPTWDNIDTMIGFRPVEKSPLDLYKMGEARDTGISVKATLDKNKKTTAWLMFGNGSGTKGETDKGKAIYALVSHWLTPEIYLEGYVDFWDKLGDTDWRTFSGWAMFQREDFRVQIFGANQRREKPGKSDLDLTVLSFYTDVKVSKNAKAFFRADFLSNPVPDADKIAYLSLATNARPTLYIVGVDFALTENVHIIPNVEFVTYDEPVSGSKPNDDLFLRLTFYYVWK